MIAVYSFSALFPNFFFLILCMMMLIMMIQVILDPNLGKWNIPSFPPHWQHRSAAAPRRQQLLSALSLTQQQPQLLATSSPATTYGCHIFPQKSCCRHQNQWKAHFPHLYPTNRHYAQYRRPLPINRDIWGYLDAKKCLSKWNTAFENLQKSLIL